MTNAPSTPVADAPNRLELLRAPFPPHQISKLPRGTKTQNECPASERRNCSICGGWHHPLVKHLDYVGHAALTDRLLDCDPAWNWEPLALDADGLPRFDDSGGLWIRLTVCGVTRLGYGHAEAKSWMTVGDRVKEVIGDCIRNSGMRFGAALDLWHKGDLHVIEGKVEEKIEIKPELDPEVVKRLEVSLSLSSLQHEYGKLTKDQRIAYAETKDAVKARIAALDLWHKGNLHADEEKARITITPV